MSSETQPSNSSSENKKDPLATESDYYKLLGVERDATDDQIKKGYRKMAIKYHPDKGGDAEIFKKVSHAYSILSDPEKKKVYDTYGESGIQGDMGTEEYENFDPFNMFGSFFGFDDDFGFSDFSGMGGKRHRRQKAEDIKMTLMCTLEEVYTGTTRVVTVKRRVCCKDCNGKGGNVVDCKRCKGSGRIHRVLKERGMVQEFQEMCSTCNGSGRFIPQNNRCKKCSGRGTFKESKKIQVNIPAGAEEETPIRVKNEGNEESGVKPGDVVFTLTIEEHDVYQRFGANLVTSITLSMAEALCGFTRELTTLDGRKLPITSNQGCVISSKTVKKILNEGMPMKNGNKGYLEIFFDVQYPKTILPNVATEIAALLDYKIPEKVENEIQMYSGSEVSDAGYNEESEIEQEESDSYEETSQDQECCIF